MASAIVTVQSVQAQIQERKRAWELSLSGSGMTFDRFAQGIMQAIRNNPKLLECADGEVVRAAGRAAVLGLDVSGMTGEAHLVGPLGTAKKCELWKGVHGVAKMTYRSGLVRVIQPAIVREGDDFDVDFGSDKPLTHKPKGGTGPILAWYAQVRMATGGVLLGIVWRDEADGLVIDAKERLGGAFKYTPWATHADAMLLKTAVMRAVKWAPKSVEQAEVLSTGDDDAASVAELPQPARTPVLESDASAPALGHEDAQAFDVPATRDAEKVPARDAFDRPTDDKL